MAPPGGCHVWYRDGPAHRPVGPHRDGGDRGRHGRVAPNGIRPGAGHTPTRRPLRGSHLQGARGRAARQLHVGGQASAVRPPGPGGHRRQGLGRGHPRPGRGASSDLHPVRLRERRPGGRGQARASDRRPRGVPRQRALIGSAVAPPGLALALGLPARRLRPCLRGSCRSSPRGLRPCLPQPPHGRPGGRRRDTRTGNEPGREAACSGARRCPAR